DKYGQYKHVDWPGKVYRDTDLTNAADAKAGSQIFADASPSWNKYGGWEDGPTLKATGFFYAAQHKGKWWLVDPSGKLFWSYGPTGVGFGGGSPITDREKWFEELPAKDGHLGEFYGTGSKARFKYYEHRESYETFNYAHANLKRAYGDNWKEDAAKGIHGKLKKWGINTMAAWSGKKIYEAQKTPYTTMIHFGGPWITWEHHYRMPDPFDEGFRLAVREALEKNPKTANDPWNIGYFVNNELGWGPGINGNRTAIATLAKAWGGKKQAAKVAFVNDLKAKYKTINALNKKWGSRYASWDDILEKRQKPNEKRAKADLDAFSGKLAHQYFRVVREEVKRFAPNNMYLGCRFHGHIDNSLMAIAMEHVDVVSYNIYQNEPTRSYQYTELKDKKPLMVTEFGVATNPEQSPWRGKHHSPAADQRERDLTKYLKYLLKNPQFVGAHFFQYHDQALTGRNDGEALLRGFVDAVGAPNFRLIEVNRNIMFDMYEDRFKYVPPKKPVKGTYKAPAGPIDDSFKKVRGIHHYSEQGKFLNKKLGWGKGCDTQEYSWDKSASIRWDGSQKAEGNGSYRFTLNKGWSRWVMHLTQKKTIDFTPYSAIKFAVSSKDAAKWDAFSVIIQDSKGNYIGIPLKDVGFKPDGNFHLIRLDIKALQKGGVDMSSISTLLQISWGGGVAKGHSFNLDGLHVVK
ncbi:MAG: beta-galactosidase, partial [Lentisphaeria bacterium]|nr:beta-galactosidase [Lentisphaeria bacterium]